MVAPIIGALGGILFNLGAPLLANAIGTNLGTGAGSIAGAALETLGGALGVKADEADIFAKLNGMDASQAHSIVQVAERNFEAEFKVIAGDMANYRDLLREDAKDGGILARLWRPVFAFAYTFSFLWIVVIVGRAIWISDTATITSLVNLVPFLIFLYSAGCAVLGVYVWKRTSEKQDGVE